ncbi:hypothetical protein LXL04_004948 [Taraxacum kok-saghyz]
MEAHTLAWDVALSKLPFFPGVPPLALGGILEEERFMTYMYAILSFPIKDDFNRNNCYKIIDHIPKSMNKRKEMNNTHLTPPYHPKARAPVTVRVNFGDGGSNSGEDKNNSGDLHHKIVLPFLSSAQRLKLL